MHGLDSRENDSVFYRDKWVKECQWDQKFLGCMPKFGKWDWEKYTKILSDLLVCSVVMYLLQSL